VEPISVLLTVFGIFIPALILPGPDFVAVVRSSMTRGARAGLLTTIGVSFGLGLYATLSLVGLSAVLVKYEWLTWAVRVLGGCYLAYLGLRLVLLKSSSFDVPIDGHQAGAGNALLFGFLVALTNPKAIVLFASVFATAVTSSTPDWLKLLMIGLVFVSTLTWYSVVSLFMSSSPVMRRLQNAKHWIEKAAGVCFIAIAGRILADARNPVTP
jgi:threonine efflux protein